MTDRTREQAEAAKLYSLLYRGANIYNAKRSKGSDDPVRRFVDIVAEFKQFLKANEQ